MKNFIFLCVMAFLILSSKNGFSQLVDWGRYNQYQKEREQEAQMMRSESTEKKVIHQEQRNIPHWMTNDLKVVSADDSRYDINQDGYLQPSESRVYLRRTVEEIERKGRVTYRSDLLKEYDKNKDGVITREEAAMIRADVF